MKTSAKENKIQEAEKFYASFLKFTQSVYAGIGLLDIDSITKMTAELRNEIQHNCRFLLYAMNCIEPEKNENYLASHAVRTTVIAMIIGRHLKIAPHRQLELGVAALLHDIGMLTLPPEAYINELDIKAKNNELIINHPVQGYNLLKSIKCPPAISSAVLEHHERENGSGYPRQLKGEQISVYGKIIAVACSYEALSAKRSYKKMKDQHSGIVELVKNKENKYDINIVRALVATFSIYPIGMHVLLSNGRQGRIYDINPINQHYPVVKLDDDMLVFTSAESVSISSFLTLEEIERKKQGWCSAKDFISKQRPVPASA